MTSPQPVTGSSHESPGKEKWTKRLSQRLKRTSLGSSSKHDTASQDYPNQEDTLQDLQGAEGRRASEDEIIGLDMKGKARRRSTASSQPRSPVSPSSEYSSAHSLAQQSSQSPAPVRDGQSQTVEGQQSGEIGSRTQSNIGSREGVQSRGSSSAHNTTSTTQLPTIKRKELPVDSHVSPPSSPRQAGHSSASQLSGDSSKGDITGERGTGLPIASEFLNRQAPPDKRSSLDAARDILGQRDYSRQAHPNGHGVSEDTQLPTAEEIVERSKYNSSDTTYHERVAPAVTHERIDTHIHNIEQKHITRDIHHYHQIHRILPIHEVEMLPAKHYRIVDGRQVEMKPEEVPQSRIDAWESAIVPKIEENLKI